MFSSEEQKARAARTLLRRIGYADQCWTAEGQPTDFLIRLKRKNPGMSDAERALCLFTLDLWNGEGGTCCSDMVHRLDKGNLYAFGSLLVALALGSAHVEVWIADQEEIQRGELDAVSELVSRRAAQKEEHQKERRRFTLG